MRNFRISIFLLAAIVVLADLSFAQTRRTTGSTRQTSGISNAEITSGLKEALFQGVRRSVGELGREDGFYANPRVKIPLPKNLQRVEKTLRFAGQGGRVDEFVEAMNRAAERAVPEATDIFLDSIRQMTFADARNILSAVRTTPRHSFSAARANSACAKNFARLSKILLRRSASRSSIKICSADTDF
jgi:hypothetical protein